MNMDVASPNETKAEAWHAFAADRALAELGTPLATGLSLAVSSRRLHSIPLRCTI